MSERLLLTEGILAPMDANDLFLLARSKLVLRNDPLDKESPPRDFRLLLRLASCTCQQPLSSQLSHRCIVLHNPLYEFYQALDSE